MSARTLAFLLAAVLLLSALAWWQLRSEVDPEGGARVALFEGVDPSRVTSLRVENVERDQNMRFERDAAGRWRMVSPVEVEAEQALVDHLLATALDRRGTLVPEAERDVQALRLAPPRAVIEIEEDAGGSRVRRSVELGALDLDGKRVNVRARGMLLRTWRDLDTTLDRRVEEFMTHEALGLSPAEVVEIHRRGRLAPDGPEVPGGSAEAQDLAFDALAEGGAWRATAPFPGALDPQGISLWLQGLCALRIDAYVDHGRRLLSDFGLDPPEMEVTLVTLDERRATLRFGRAGVPRGGPWHCAREGLASVWGLEDRPVRLIGVGVEELLDRAILRLPRASIDGIRLVLGGRELRLWLEVDRAGKRTWRVAERPAADAAFGPRLLADAGKVADLLGRIERAEFARFLPGETIGAGEARGSLAVQAGDERQGGTFGAAEGTSAVRFQRQGDRLAGLVAADLFDLLSAPANDLWTLALLDLPEHDQLELAIAGPGEAGQERRYRRGSKGLWTPPDLEVEARELRDVLDPLFFLRASRHVGLGPVPALVDEVRVRFTSADGAVTSFAIGQDPGATPGEATQVDLEGRRSVLKDQDLHRRLLAVLGKRL